MLKATIKKIPLLGTALKYILGTCIKQRGGKKYTTFFSYKAKIPDLSKYELTKINKTNSLYRDRFDEVKYFFGKSTAGMFLHYLAYGTPNTNYYKYQLNRIFEQTGLTEAVLKKSYEKAAFMYVNRLMLRYHNYLLAEQVLEILNKQGKPKERVKILDYGCGVADPSLYLALHDVDVTIVDLADAKFDFACWRFAQRNLDVQSVRVTQTELPADLGDQHYDIILMAEFLEHVRNPRLFLEFALAHLKDEGVLYDSLGAFHDHTIAGDHLGEAKRLMETSDYAEFHQKNLRPLNNVFESDRFSHFYIKTCD